ncbi:MAG: transporter substrate-binding domain-containing protein [Usitatibacter sp.]
MKITKLFAALAVLALAGCAATAPTLSPTAKSELAPQGRVRVAILPTNPLYVTPGTEKGEMQGLAPDIARALAKQLGAEMVPVPYPSAMNLLDAAKRNEWDVAFIGYAAERRADMEFTPVIVNGENSYLVRNDSPLRSVADIDRAGVRIAVSDRTVQHNFLRQNVRSATLVSTAHNAASLQLLVSGSVDAVAGNRMAVTESGHATPGTRVLDGSFMHVPYALATRKGNAAGTAYATEFVQYLKESGMLDDSLKRANLSGVTVARDYAPSGTANVPPPSTPARRY